MPSSKTSSTKQRKTGPLTTDWSAAVRRAFKGAHEDVLKEAERLKRLGILDERGRLVKKS